MDLDQYREMLDVPMDDQFKDLIARIMFESEEAKQILRDKEYGWSGLSIVETVKLVRHSYGEMYDDGDGMVRYHRVMD